MEPGYYMSTFFDYGELRNILEIKLRHDHAAALWHYNGSTLSLVRYWEFERLSGIKQHPHALYNRTVAHALMEELLREEGLSVGDLCAVWGTRAFNTDTDYRAQFDQTFAFHGVAHLMTAIHYGNDNPFGDTIVGLTLDAGPDSMFEQDAYSRHYYPGCVIQNGQMTMFSVESPARLWSYSRKTFGLREGTLMALASAIPASLDVPLAAYDQYSFDGPAARTSARSVVEDIVRRADTAISLDADLCFDPRFTPAENRLSLIMKVVAAMSERIVSRNLDSICAQYRVDPSSSILAMAGGFALNCPTNTALIERYRFADYQIPPCTSDTGIALGVGLAAFHSELRSGSVKVRLDTAYYGQTGGEIDAEVAEFARYVEGIDEVCAEQIAAELAIGSIVVWVNGNAEIGPRALGNRSLLADPRSTAVRDRLNHIKRRQWWRPVAPVVMDAHAAEYFNGYRDSPYMLLSFAVKPEAAASIPGVVHLDGTARVQSITCERNPHLYSVIDHFRSLTGIPMLGNTSLNDAGEPIVNRLREAIALALRKGLTSVYYEGRYKISLCQAPTEMGKPTAARQSSHYFGIPADVDAIDVSHANPHQLSIEELTFYYDNPLQFRDGDISTLAVADSIKAATVRYLRVNPCELTR
ncbi:carbamoyltransferase C-terminal domain-containing protein [Nocardia sp. CA-128927]|uniref:carbamoyltransferase C-terminal domain-containing protein n=1 Tax=Nocardia sp. CA-128927 TaxID=3239975 RepID=UPI003D98AFAF